MAILLAVTLDLLQCNINLALTASPVVLEPFIPSHSETF